MNELALAWTEAKKGCFKDEYFDPVVIPTIEHIPWVHKNIPIPMGMLNKLINLFQEKIAAGVYEPSNAPYRSCWFCMPKKNGKLCLIHDLQPLNQVTIKNVAILPLVKQFTKSFAGRACFSLLDLFIGYDHCALAVESCNLTTFLSPLGALHNTSLPQGWMSSVPIFHGDLSFILELEIPHVAKPFVNDCGMRGPATRYETADGGFEVIPDNPGIHHFVWEHLMDVHQVMHQLGHAGMAISAPKLFICVPEVVILGHKCTYDSCLPDDSKVAKIQDWMACESPTEVCAFLGTCGTMSIWIPRYSELMHLLNDCARTSGSYGQRSMLLPCRNSRTLCTAHLPYVL